MNVGCFSQKYINVRQFKRNYSSYFRILKLSFIVVERWKVTAYGDTWFNDSMESESNR
jgi:hypothetical protein